MIRYDQVADLEGEQAERVRALIDRSSNIWDMPADLEQVEAWEEQIAACEAEGVPHLAASARFGQLVVYLGAGLAAESIQAYTRLMQLVQRYADHIHPENLARFVEEIPDVAAVLVEDPSVPREKMELVVSLAEQQIRMRGLDHAAAYLARAELASEFGDHDATLEMLVQMYGARSEYWHAGNLDAVLREIDILTRVDAEQARSTLEQRLAAHGIAPGPIDPDHPELKVVARLRALQGVLYAQTGRRDVAAQIGDELLDQFGAEWLSDNVEAQDRLVLTEHHPEVAQVIADEVLHNDTLTGAQLRRLAATARTRVLADPEADEGWLLFALAEESARRHDERGGTTQHGDALREFWKQGLPDAPQLPVVHDESVWGNQEARAEHILMSGWIPRQTEGVDVDRVPIAMRDAYLETISSISALSEEEVQADEIDRIIARATDLRLTLSVFGAVLIGALQRGQTGDTRGMLEGLDRSQQLRLDHDATLYGGLRAAAENGYQAEVNMAISDPEISIPEVTKFIEREHEVRQAVGGPTSQLVLGQAEVAAHFGDRARLEELLKTANKWREYEGDDVDGNRTIIECASLAAPFDPNLTRALASIVHDKSYDPEQQRAALAWLAWCELGEGRPGLVGEVVSAVEEIGRDIDEFGPVPYDVLVQLAEANPAELGWLVEAVLDTIVVEGAPAELPATAAAAAFFLRHRPDDERGPRYRDLTRDIAARLDARNGNDYQSRQLRERWLKEFG